MSGSELERVVASIEAKLALLERQREELDEEIELKQAQITELRSTIESLRNLQQQLAKPA